MERDNQQYKVHYTAMSCVFKQFRCDSAVRSDFWSERWQNIQVIKCMDA